MSLRCEICGRFISYSEPYEVDYEPLSEFGPERIEFVHTACAEAKAIETRSAETPKSGSARQGESAVAKRFAQEVSTNKLSMRSGGE